MAIKNWKQTAPDVMAGGGPAWINTKRKVLVEIFEGGESPKRYEKYRYVVMKITGNYEHSAAIGASNSFAEAKRIAGAYMRRHPNG